MEIIILTLHKKGRAPSLKFRDFEDKSIIVPTRVVRKIVYRKKICILYNYVYIFVFSI